jgi:hypothetical protein
MKKGILTLLSLLVAVFIGLYLFSSGKFETSHLKNAQRQEALGRNQAAVSDYCAALEKAADGRRIPNIPDKVAAANLTPSLWQNEIAEFILWLGAYKQARAEVGAIFEGLDRCASGATHDNFIYDIKQQKAAFDAYKCLWQQVFCPEKPSLASDQTGLIKKAFEQGDVIVTLLGNSTYSYEVGLVNKESGKRTIVTVELDKNPSFLVKPGAYYAVCTSKKLFASSGRGKSGWTSNTEALVFNVPDTVTVFSASLRTEVNRQK